MEIPAWLVEFFGRLNLMILRGDHEAVTPSDDFIQDNRIVGRLSEDEEYYDFTVFPGPDRLINRPRWELAISRYRVAQLAEGEIKYLDLWECENPDCLNLFPNAKSLCFYCDYQDSERDERNAVKLQLLTQEFDTREEWVNSWLARFPDDGLSILGDYNSTGLGYTLGWFTMDELESIVKRFRASRVEKPPD